MCRLARVVPAFVIVWATADLSVAQEMKPDIADGRRYAETWCSVCHAIDAKSTRKRDNAPDFVSVANRRSTTVRRLVRFLYSKHDNMPSFEIELDDATNVAAYIVSLKRR